LNIDFHCTKCAKCCHDLRLPLSVAEAVEWLSRGDTVEVLCEMVPWPDGQDLAHAEIVAKQSRTFAAMSGTLPVRIGVVLAASHAGPCPNLLSNGECGIYGERPSVCRIYPAEVNPFVTLRRSAKACPDDAWDASGAPLLRHGVLVDASLRSEIAVRRQCDVADIETKRRLCTVLGLNVGAVWNEGFFRYAPDGATLFAALSVAGSDAGIADGSRTEWTFVSHRRTSIDALQQVGACGMDVREHPDIATDYLSFN
jgi:Fe-S-cluster containining protein